MKLKDLENKKNKKKSKNSTITKNYINELNL